MEKKIFNYITSFFNYFAIFLYFYIGKMLLKLEPKLVTFTIIPFSEKYTFLLKSMIIPFGILFVCNLICIFQNIKNKKLLIWYIPSVFFNLFMIINLIIEENILSEYLINIMLIIYVISIIINFIIDLRNIKVKRIKLKLILYILLLLVCFLKSVKLILIVVLIMQIFYNKKLNESKKITKILNVIFILIEIIIILYFSISAYLMKAKIYKVNDETIDYVEKVVKELRKEEIQEDQILIPVKNNNKMGYINQYGDEIIECEYDNVSLTDYEYVVIVKKGNTYYALARNGKVLNYLNNIPLPFLTEKVMKKVTEDNPYTETEHQKIIMANIVINDILESYLEEDNKIENNNKELEDEEINIEDLFNRKNDNEIISDNNYYYNENNNRVYKFELENGNLLEVEEVINEIDEEEIKLNLKILNNDKIIAEYKNINIPWDMYLDESQGEIETLKNGNIVFGDLEKKISGIFNRNFEKIFEINGDYQILDVVNNNILIRDYSDFNNIKEIIMDKEKNILVEGKEIEVLDDGYIIKKYNNKIVYSDSNLTEKVKEYDYIKEFDYNGDKGYEEKLLICGKKEGKDERYYLFDKTGNLITEKGYQKIGINVLPIYDTELEFEEILYSDFYELDDIYYNYYESLNN